MQNNLTLAQIDEMRKCAKRELNRREYYYPKWVASGKMTQEKADFETEGMRKIVDHFNWQMIHAKPEQMKLL